MRAEPLIVDEACWERGCACHDSRDSPGIQLVERRDWVGLTDEEREEITEWLGHDVSSQVFYAIEAKLKEKNSVTRMGNGSTTTKPVA
jgi:hypothetical protein